MILGELQDEAVTEPAAAGAGGDDESVQHFVCCDDNVAMCGQDVAEAGWAPGEQGIPCPLCKSAIEAGLACPVMGCTGLPVTAWLGL